VCNKRERTTTKDNKGKTKLENTRKFVKIDGKMLRFATHCTPKIESVEIGIMWFVISFDKAHVKYRNNYYN